MIVETLNPKSQALNAKASTTRGSGPRPHSASWTGPILAWLAAVGFRMVFRTARRSRSLGEGHWGVEFRVLGSIWA